MRGALAPAGGAALEDAPGMGSWDAMDALSRRAPVPSPRCFRPPSSPRGLVTSSGRASGASTRHGRKAGDKIRRWGVAPEASDASGGRVQGLGAGSSNCIPNGSIGELAPEWVELVGRGSIGLGIRRGGVAAVGDGDGGSDASGGPVLGLGAGWRRREPADSISELAPEWVELVGRGSTEVGSAEGVSLPIG